VQQPGSRTQRLHHVMEAAERRLHRGRHVPEHDLPEPGIAGGPRQLPRGGQVGDRPRTQPCPQQLLGLGGQGPARTRVVRQHQPSPRTEQTMRLLEEGPLVHGVAHALPRPDHVERLGGERGPAVVLATERDLPRESPRPGEPSPPRGLAPHDRDALDSRTPVLGQPEGPSADAATGVEDVVSRADLRHLGHHAIHVVEGLTMGSGPLSLIHI